jgi:hypothetical protein
MVARYFLTTVTKTGSKGILTEIFGSSMLGLEAAHSAMEWRRGNDAGRWLDSGTVKMSQKR